ncbi:LysR family transcriptional regulator [Halomonas sp. HMF6819]|uniref:LysR family transcriptional regulator n=1 Tax=Halomonas sp. HMF6819 TaxID=3373085 RepID=UPI0037A59C87
MSQNLNLLKMFIAVAKANNFRAAADQLGMTRSAVSQGVQKLESTLGRPLFNRTTRSVRLTEEGARLYREIEGPLEEIASALDVALDSPESPQGTLKVTATSIAERFLSGPLIADFIERYPGITLDIVVSDEAFDIVTAGFDAGIRLGEVIEQDMIAIPLTGKQRQVAVASPDYLARHGSPAHPGELIRHRCIGWRLLPETAPYRWEFERDGSAFDVAVNPQVTTNDMLLMIRTALAGGGITFGMEETFLPYIEQGQLVPILNEWLAPFTGFYLYYPSRRTVTPRLRALIDHIKQYR